MLKSFLKEAEQWLRMSLISKGSLPLNGVEPPFFNHVSMAVNTTGDHYVVRLANPEWYASTETKIRRDYQELGLLDMGGDFEVRSPLEQKKFHEYCAQKGLSIPKIVFANQHGMILEFIKGEPLSVLGNMPEYAGFLCKYLKSVHFAHQQGIILGDRHGGNVLIVPDGKVWHIDFDVKLKGSAFLREFELSEAVFFAIASSRQKDESALVIKDWLFARSEYYCLERITHFLKRYHDLKSKHKQAKYENTLPTLKGLIDRLRVC